MTVRCGQGFGLAISMYKSVHVHIYPDPPSCAPAPTPTPTPAMCVCLYIYAQSSPPLWPSLSLAQQPSLSNCLWSLVSGVLPVSIDSFHFAGHWTAEKSQKRQMNVAIISLPLALPLPKATGFPHFLCLGKCLSDPPALGFSSYPSRNGLCRRLPLFWAIFLLI